MAKKLTLQKLDLKKFSSQKLALRKLSLKKLALKKLVIKNIKLGFALEEQEKRPFKKLALGLKRDVKADDEILASLRRLRDAELQSSGLQISENSVVRRSSSICLDKLCNHVPMFGLVWGRLSYYGEHGEFTCLHSEYATSHTNEISALETDALFILLVNSVETFQCRKADGFFNRFPCIMFLTGKLPDCKTRIFLKMLKMELKLPVFALMECDPYAIRLLSVYMYGSEDDPVGDDGSKLLPMPDIKWLGMRPTDIAKFGIPEKVCLLPLNEQEKADAKVLIDLLKGNEAVMSDESWVQELKVMEGMEHKVETLTLCFFSSQYLRQVYLPLKLQESL